MFILDAIKRRVINRSDLSNFFLIVRQVRCFYSSTIVTEKIKSPGRISSITSSPSIT